MPRFLSLLGVVFLVAPCPTAAPPKPWWDAEVERSLSRAGENRAELRTALTSVPVKQRGGMAFLLAHMPDRDCRSLKADFLLENVALAYQAIDQAPWGKTIPEALFLNDVLPYANLDETREPWRKSMRELCLPIVKDCKTATEAAVKLNATLFHKVKVKYSTTRKKPNQSPKESMDQGVASCSGLSILLVDACRSVGVPARVVGTPLWANKRGNHTWVEVWDGQWHFTGACEQDPNGLDRGWFTHDASQAVKDSPAHAIYAASFRRTDVTFPLVWDRKGKDVHAENVTDRYASKKASTDKVRVQIRVCREGTKQRVAVPVAILDADKKVMAEGTSKGEGADTNDFLTIELLPNRAYVVRVGKTEKVFEVKAGKEMLVDVEVPPARR